MRRYVITGGLGLLGQRIARHLINSTPPPPPTAAAAGTAAVGRGGCRSTEGVRVMIVDKGLLGNETGGRAAAAAAATNTRTAASSADDSWSSSSGSSSGAGSVEGSMQSILGGCGTTAGGGAPSSIVIVHGDLTSTDIAAEIKTFAAGAATGHDGDRAATSLLSIFHLASVMSGHAENDFVEALRVNVDGKKVKMPIRRNIFVMSCSLTTKNYTSYEVPGTIRSTWYTVIMREMAPGANVFFLIFQPFKRSYSQLTFFNFFASNRSLKNMFSSISSTPSIHADYLFEIQAL